MVHGGAWVVNRTGTRGASEESDELTNVPGTSEEMFQIRKRLSLVPGTLTPKLVTHPKLRRCCHEFEQPHLHLYRIDAQVAQEGDGHAVAFL